MEHTNHSSGELDHFLGRTDGRAGGRTDGRTRNDIVLSRHDREKTFMKIFPRVRTEKNLGVWSGWLTGWLADGRTDGRTDRQTDGRTGGWTDGRTRNDIMLSRHDLAKFIRVNLF